MSIDFSVESNIQSRRIEAVLAIMHQSQLAQTDEYTELFYALREMKKHKDFRGADIAIKTIFREISSNKAVTRRVKSRIQLAAF